MTSVVDLPATQGLHKILERLRLAEHRIGVDDRFAGIAEGGVDAMHDGMKLSALMCCRSARCCGRVAAPNAVDDRRCAIAADRAPSPKWSVPFSNDCASGSKSRCATGEW